MSIEYKRMQQRYGTYTEYLEHQNELLPNEFAFVVSGCPYTDSGQAIYVRIGTASPVLLSTVTASSLEDISESINDIDDRLSDVEDELTPMHKAIADSIASSYNSVFPEFTHSFTAPVTVSQHPELLQNSPYYDLSNFDSDVDGILIFRSSGGDNTLIISSAYHFESVTNATRIQFGPNVHFNSDELLGFFVYKKPESPSGGGGQLANNLSPIAVTNGGGVVPVTFSNNYSTFEICVAYTFNGSPTYSAGAALCGGTSYTNCPTMEMVADNGGSMFYGFCSRNGSGWDHVAYANISSYITADTTGYFRIKYDGSAVTLSHSTDGINFTPVDSFSATGAPNVSGVLEIGHCGGSSGDHWFNTAGTINFADCYVMLDDELVWGNNALVSPRGSCVVTCSGATYSAMQTHSDKILYVIT